MFRFNGASNDSLKVFDQGFKRGQQLRRGCDQIRIGFHRGRRQVVTRVPCLGDSVLSGVDRASLSVPRAGSVGFHSVQARRV